MIQRIVASLPALLILGLACSEAAPDREWTASQHAQPASSDVDPNRVPEQQRRPERQPESEGDREARAAAALWNISCASCHGRDGKGEGPAAPGPMPDFTTSEYQAGTTDEELASVIANGRGSMPAFGERISEDGIRALLGHIRRFTTEAPSAPTEPPSEPTEAPSEPTEPPSE